MLHDRESQHSIQHAATFNNNNLLGEEDTQESNIKVLFYQCGIQIYQYEIKSYADCATKVSTLVFYFDHHQYFSSYPNSKFAFSKKEEEY